MFQLRQDESELLRRQIGTLKSGRGQHRKYLPWVFTEHGAIMAANVGHSRRPRSCQLPSLHLRLPARLPLARVLNSQRAVQMSVFVVRAFLKMRALLGDKRELAQKLASLEKELKKRLDVHETARNATTAETAHRIHTLNSDFSHLSSGQFPLGTP